MLQDTKGIPGGSVKFPAASGGEFVPERLKALIMLAAGGINNLNFFYRFYDNRPFQTGRKQI